MIIGIIVASAVCTVKKSETCQYMIEVIALVSTYKSTDIPYCAKLPS
jgi:hypothetical protein